MTSHWCTQTRRQAEQNIQSEYTVSSINYIHLVKTKIAEAFKSNNYTHYNITKAKICNKKKTNKHHS